MAGNFLVDCFFCAGEVDAAGFAGGARIKSRTIKFLKLNTYTSM